MRILVIMTGGTIGSVTVDGVTDLDDEIQGELLERYKARYHSEVEFTTVRAYNRLSENLTPRHWESLHRTVRESRVESYDGVILTHGSDTLSYTSALCAHLYGHLKIPFVITAANHPLDHEKSNGLDNFHTGVTLIAARKWTGAFTVYQNDLGEDEVHLAHRIEEADILRGRFRSFGGTTFAKRVGDEIVVRDGRAEVCPKRAFNWKGDVSFKNRVLLLHSHPGLCYEDVRIREDVKAVMLCLYHSSTSCVKEEGHSATQFIEECGKKGVRVYLYYLKCLDGRRYVTTEALLRAGGVPMEATSKETAYTGLLLSYNVPQSGLGEGGSAREGDACGREVGDG